MALIDYDKMSSIWQKHRAGISIIRRLNDLANNLVVSGSEENSILILKDIALTVAVLVKLFPLVGVLPDSVVTSICDKDET